MYFLLTDETNLEPSKNAEFFVYGGLIVPAEKFTELDRGISVIRANAGYLPADLLKFETRTRPSHVDIDSAAGAKQAVIDLCRETGCTFLAYVILHKIAKNKSRDDMVLFGMNTVLERFNRFLDTRGSVGMCLADTLPMQSSNRYFREKFSLGLDFSEERKLIPNIRLYGTTCIGASHLASAIDIVLGSFRYAVNQPKNETAAADMMVKIGDLMWGVREVETLNVLEAGLTLRPKLDTIRVPQYRARYDDLISRMEALDEVGLARRN